MNCSTCQTSLPAEAKFCPSCGVLVPAAAAEPHPHVVTGATLRLRPDPAAPSSHDAPICAHCQQPMEPGFIPDFDDRTGADPQFWVRGSPERNPQTKHVQIHSHDLFLLTAYRCPQCGLVLLYARTPK